MYTGPLHQQSNYGGVSWRWSPRAAQHGSTSGWTSATLGPVAQILVLRDHDRPNLWGGRPLQGGQETVQWLVSVGACHLYLTACQDCQALTGLRLSRICHSSTEEQQPAYSHKLPCSDTAHHLALIPQGPASVWHNIACWARLACALHHTQPLPHDPSHHNIAALPHTLTPAPRLPLPSALTPNMSAGERQ